MRARIVTPLLAVLGFVFVLSSLPANTADTASAETAAGACDALAVDDTVWGSYDFLSADWRCNNVDWHTDLLFLNGGAVNTVKSALNYWYSDVSTNGMHMAVIDRGGDWVWDDDKGRKGLICPGPGMTTRHYRIYADGDDYLYQTNYGPFSVASTHWDKSECAPSGTLHYGSEDVENHIGNYLASTGYQVSHDWTTFFNNEPYPVEGKHIWEGNGLATYVNMTR